MKFLVTGGSGFIGSNIVMGLQERGHEVITTIMPSEQKLEKFKGKKIAKPFYELDEKDLSGVEVLLHQAAINDTTLMDAKLMNKINAYDSIDLFQKAAKQGCKRIVYASSTAIYGDALAPYIEGITKLNPLNPYAESKKLLEELAIKFSKENPDVTIVGLRYCNVYGPGENLKGKRATMIYQLAQQMKTENPKIFKWGEQKRDYIYVKDVVEANILAANTKENCIVNCGFGKAVTFNDLVKILNETLGIERKAEYLDNPYIKMYQNYTECNMSLAKKKIGFVPKYDIVKGIEDYCKTGFLI